MAGLTKRAGDEHLASRPEKQPRLDLVLGKQHPHTIQLRGGVARKKRGRKSKQPPQQPAQQSAQQPPQQSFQQGAQSGQRVTPPLSDFDGYYPPDSCGRPFPKAEVVPQALIDAITQPPHRSRDNKLGIEGHPMNTCYRNAALTALLNSDRFMAYLTNWHMPQEHDQTRGYQANIGHLLAHIADINEAADTQPSPHISRKDVKKNLFDAVAVFFNRTCYPKGGRPATSCILPLMIDMQTPNTWANSSGTPRGAQEDAEKFLGWLLGAIGGQLDHIEHQRNFWWVSRLSRVSWIVCPHCKYRMRNRSALLTDYAMQVHIPPKKIGTNFVWSRSLQLEDLIGKTMEESLSDFRCDRCNRKSDDCKREYRILHPPAHLTLKLVRGQQGEIIMKKDRKTGDSVPKYADCRREELKDFSTVHIPEELDVTQWLSPHEFSKDSKVKYRLSAVISHRGKTVFGGHWVSYVRSGLARDKWALMDDDKVSDVSLSQFDDTLAEPKDRARFVPTVLMYERVFGEDNVTESGRQPYNPNDSGAMDEKPERWTGEERNSPTLAPPVVSGTSGPVLLPANPPPSGMSNLSAGGSIRNPPPPPIRINPTNQPPQNPGTSTGQSSASLSLSSDLSDVDEAVIAEYEEFLRQKTGAAAIATGTYFEGTIKIGKTTIDIPASALADFDMDSRQKLELTGTLVADHVTKEIKQSFTLSATRKRKT